MDSKQIILSTINNMQPIVNQQSVTHILNKMVQLQMDFIRLYHSNWFLIVPSHIFVQHKETGNFTETWNINMQHRLVDHRTHLTSIYARSPDKLLASCLYSKW